MNTRMLEKAEHTLTPFSEGETHYGHALQEVSWPELRNQFVKMHKARKSLHPLPNCADGGSFAPEAARYLHQNPDLRHNGLNGINPSASILGKDACAICSGITMRNDRRGTIQHD